MMKNNSRRDFLKMTGLAIGGSLISPLIFKEQAWADPKVPMVAAADPTAKAVKYVEDFKKSPLSKGNKCSTCSFYKKVEQRGGKEVGTCLIFAGKYVYGEAYCNSWAKKA